MKRVSGRLKVPEFAAKGKAPKVSPEAERQIQILRKLRLSRCYLTSCTIELLGAWGTRATGPHA